MLIGAWLAGATFGIAGSSVHHKLCHILGGSFNLPHADTHAALLPWSARLGCAHMPAAAQAISQALGAGDAVDGIRELEAQLGVTTTLADLGLTMQDLQPVLDQLDLGQLGLPFTVERRELEELVKGAAFGS